MQARESQINERQNTTTAIKNKVTHKAYFPIFLFIYLTKRIQFAAGAQKSARGSGFLWPIAKDGAAFRAFLWFFCMPAEGRRRLQSCKKQYIIETRENGERQLYGFRDF